MLEGTQAGFSRCLSNRKRFLILFGHSTRAVAVMVSRNLASVSSGLPQLDPNDFLLLCISSTVRSAAAMAPAK